MGCKDKKVYYTKTQARKNSKRVSRKKNKEMFFYVCDDCGWYHLSSTPKTKVYTIPSAGIRFRVKI